MKKIIVKANYNNGKSSEEIKNSIEEVSELLDQCMAVKSIESVEILCTEKRKQKIM